METTPMETETTTATTPAVAVALPQFSEECARARGDETIPADEPALSIIGAHCDYSASMRRREHWYRMAWRNGTWEYIGERLQSVGMRAAERHQTKYADVWAGEIIAQHDRGKPIDSIYLIVKAPLEPKAIKEPLTFRKRRDGRLDIILPDRTIVALPDPRR